jgi:predicted TPR repeat methyltransferase
MPERHTGEGLFFTSKVVRRFVLEANRLGWIVDNQRGDFAAAAAAYRDAGGVAEADLKTQSRMGEARVLGLSGKKTEAAALYRLILKETPETPLRDLVEIQLAQTE